MISKKGSTAHSANQDTELSDAADRRRNLIAALLCYLKEACKEIGEDPFPRAHSDRKRDNGYKPKESRFSLDEVLASLVLVRHWNRLQKRSDRCPSLEVFKAMFCGTL